MSTDGLMFPKPNRSTKKVLRQQDPRYVWWIHGWHCVVLGCTASMDKIHAHHVIRRSRLGADRTCVPLCFEHHVGKWGIHVLGEETWVSKFLINLEEKIKFYNDAYDSGKVGPNHQYLPSFNPGKVKSN